MALTVVAVVTIIEKRHEIGMEPLYFFLNFLLFRAMSFCIGREGDVCAKRNSTQGGLVLINVAERADMGVGASKQAILV